MELVQILIVMESSRTGQVTATVMMVHGELTSSVKTMALIVVTVMMETTLNMHYAEAMMILLQEHVTQAKLKTVTKVVSVGQLDGLVMATAMAQLSNTARTYAALI